MLDRIHLYAKIHKAQRAWLMRATVAAGRLDTGDAAAAQFVAADARALVRHLREHGEHEERFIHPLLREAAPELASRLDAEHAALETALAALAAAADSFDGARMYRALTGFVVRYFPHLDLEEHEAMPALWRYCDDGALMAGILRPFVAARSRTEMADDVRLQIGAVSPREERQLLGALLAS